MLSGKRDRFNPENRTNFFPLDTLPDSYTAPFLDSSFFTRDHFPLVTVQSLGKGRVLGFFPGNDTPRSISDSTFLAHVSTSDFVSKVRVTRSNPFLLMIARQEPLRF
jgi:hypothetical protein